MNAPSETRNMAGAFALVFGLTVGLGGAVLASALAFAAGMVVAAVGFALLGGHE